MNRDRTRMLIVGAGESGRAAAALLRSHGIAVWLVDRGAPPRKGAGLSILKARGVHALFNARDLPPGLFAKAVISPGVPLDCAWMKELRKRGIPVQAELELGRQALRGPVSAVSGSNGKSTAAAWVHEALMLSGRPAALAGNGWTAACAAALAAKGPGVWILEASSFQLETCAALGPDVAVLLNVLPNHLERHGSMAAYLRAKSRLFSGMRRGQTAVAPYALRQRLRALQPAVERWITFGVSPGCDYRYAGGRVWLQGRAVLDVRGSLFDNAVLGPSAAAVCAWLQRLDVERSAIEQAARTLAPLPHRMQVVARQQDVTYIDNSKATNLAALGAALRLCPGPVRLIAGGRPKGEDPARLLPLLRRRVAGAYLVGEAAARWQRAWSPALRCVRCGTLAQAVTRARREAVAGDAVLLAPGCASHDQYADYIERGREFRRLVLLQRKE